MTTDHTLTSLAIAATLGTTAALTILLATAYTTLCHALDTHTNRRARHTAHTQHTTATRAIDDAVTHALDDACCEPWWTSCGADHDPTCPNQTRSTR